MYIVYISLNSGNHYCIEALNFEEISKIASRYEFYLSDNDMKEIAELENYKGTFFRDDDKTDWLTVHKISTRNVFMGIYRDEFFNERGISADDRHEIFGGIMFGESDFEATEINEMLADYGVVNIQAVDISEPFDAFCARLDNLREMSEEYHRKNVT